MKNLANTGPTSSPLSGCDVSTSILLLILTCSLAAACGEGQRSRAELLQSVRKQQANNAFAETVGPLLEYLSAHPDDAEVNFLYGRALSRTTPHLAVWSLRKAAEDEEWFVPAAMQLAIVALAANDFDEVIRITTEVLARSPENLRALMMRANAHAHSKIAPELAIADARRALDIDPAAIDAYEPLILGLLALGQMDEARAELETVGERLEESLPRNLAWHCVTMALFLQEGQRPEEARTAFDECVAAHPTNHDVITSATRFFDSRGEPRRSMEILENALAAQPRDRQLRLLQARRLAANGRGEGAKALLLEATEFPNAQTAAAAWVDLGKLLQAYGDYAGAADALEGAVERLPEDDPAADLVAFELADALILADRVDRALAVADGLRIPAHRHLIRGRARQLQRRHAEALEELDLAIEAWPDNPWARYYAASAAEQIGDFDRALTEYRNSIRSDPRATDARERAAALLVAQGNLAGARILLMTEASAAPLRIEGLLLLMRFSGVSGDMESMAAYLEHIATIAPDRVGDALDAGAAGVAQSAGPAAAADMIAAAPIRHADPTQAAALRALVRHAHAAGQIEARRPPLYRLLDSRPGTSSFEDVRALDLELSGAPQDEVRAAYEKAVELDANNPDARAGLGRALLDSDPARALLEFDRAAELDPLDPAPKLGAVRALLARGDRAAATDRLDQLLVAHPHDASAAYERARLDLEGGTTSRKTLDWATRAVRFGGGQPAAELLEQVRRAR